MSCTMEWSK